MARVDEILSDLESAVRQHEHFGRRIADLREELRLACTHPLVVEGQGRTSFDARVCLTCGTGEVAQFGKFRILGTAKRVVKTGRVEEQEMDDPNVQVRFFTWCDGGHFVAIKGLLYGYCDKHMPSSVREQIDRERAREERLNTPG
jgi:hypothetical protein